MQVNDRSTIESLPEVLDQALARLKAGESVEACLDAYPGYARDLEPLLRAGDLLQTERATSLPPEMDEWLAVGARDFAALAAQMAPKAAKPARRSKQATAARADLADLLDDALLRSSAGAPAEARVAAASEHDAELEVLVQLGARLRASAATPLPAELEAWLPAGKREFMAIAEQMAPRYAARRRRAAVRRLTAQRAAVAVVVVAVTMGAVDTASAQSLPGDTLYTWKRAHENISLALTADPQARGQLFVEYAGRRLQEFNTLVASGNKVDSAVVAETLDSLLDNVQGALATTQQAETANVNVAPAVKQILNDTKSAISQAAVAAPDTATTTVLNQVLTRADVLDQNIAVVVTAIPPTDTPTSAPGEATSSSGGGGKATATTPDIGAVIGQTSTAPIANSEAPASSPVPTLAAGVTSAPVSSPTVPPANTPTIDPATVIPPTTAPTEVPAGTATDTLPTSVPSSVPTNVPTSVPTDTVVPSATPIPATDVATVPPPPPTLTPRPTRVPPTDTATTAPTDTDTPVPPTDTDTPVPPTNTDTPVPPTNTDTPVPPTNTDTPVPSDTPAPPTDTTVPTDTLVPALSSADQTATSVAGNPSTATNVPPAPTDVPTAVPPAVPPVDTPTP